MKKILCPVGCKTALRSTAFMCDYCWKRVPSGLRRDVFLAAETASPTFKELVGQAIDQARRYRANGDPLAARVANVMRELGATEISLHSGDLVTEVIEKVWGDVAADEKPWRRRTKVMQVCERAPALFQKRWTEDGIHRVFILREEAS